MEKFDERIPIRMGVISALITIVSVLLMYVFYEKMASHLKVYGFIKISLGLFAIFMSIWSVVKYRSANGSIISLGHAFGVAYIVLIFSSVASGASQIIINKVVDRKYGENFSNIAKQKLDDDLESSGMSDADIKNLKNRVTAKSFDPPAVYMVEGTVITIAIEAIVALIIAASMKRSAMDLLESNQV